MSKDALAVCEEVLARCQRGENPKRFLASAKAFIKNPYLWQTTKKSEILLPTSEITRVVQAGVLYQKLGHKVFGVSLSEYLYGTDALEPVPSLPDWPEEWNGIFDRDVLVDGRILGKIGLSELCRLLGLSFDGDDKTFIPFDTKQSQTGIRWMRGQAGHKNHDRKPLDCRKTFQFFEVGMDVFEGISVYIQDPTVINGYFIDLPGSVHADDRDGCACLGHWGDGPELRWNFGGSANPHFGSASRGSV